MNVYCQQKLYVVVKIQKLAWNIGGMMQGKTEVLGAKPVALPLRPQLAPQFCSHHGYFTVMKWLLYNNIT